MDQKKYLVTSALPYANGPIHIGHLVEYIQTDIWVRYLKLKGLSVRYVCADDAHGTPIMLRAKQEKIDPEILISEVKKDHEDDFKRYNIHFDTYHSTHSKENQKLVVEFYEKAKQKGLIVEKTIEQFYSEADDMFLPDRFIKGTCPSCKASNQYGDSCDKCGATYDPTDLIDPVSSLSHTKPILKKTNHKFFDLAACEHVIKDWLKTKPIQPEMQNKLEEWFKAGLKAWDITRDAPYFGFKIPDTDSQYFYVWLDAPIGYLAATQASLSTSETLTDFWKSRTCEIHHFIGKDIMYFHTLFWPALLNSANYELPKAVHIHGFLTINGQKMSKSKGTFILAKDFLKASQPDFLRYYYASKLSAKAEDIDLNLEDFVLKVNADIINKVLNIGSRTAKLVHSHFEGYICEPDTEGLSYLNQVYASLNHIDSNYMNLNYAEALRSIIKSAQRINQYIDEHKPWELVKTNTEKTQLVCSTALNGLYFLMGCLQPVLPHLSLLCFEFLNCKPPSWHKLSKTLGHHRINPFNKFASRLNYNDIRKELNL